jgi:hypothetical protein
MEQMIKHISVETKSCNNRIFIFSVGSLPRDCERDKEDHLSQSSFETPACQNRNSGVEELNSEIDESELLSAVQWS